MLRRLIVGMTGATGAIYGIRILQALQKAGLETHLVVSKWGHQTIEHETDWSFDQVKALANVYHSSQNMGATISSGSFVADGMVIAPCSMRTLAAIAHGYGDTLVHRAADVTIKERRTLVIMPRETPLSDIHLENMLKLSKMGVIILPPMPAFYQKPQSIDEMVMQGVTRVLDQFGINSDDSNRWDGVLNP